MTLIVDPPGGLAHDRLVQRGAGNKPAPGGKFVNQDPHTCGRGVERPGHGVRYLFRKPANLFVPATTAKRHLNERHGQHLEIQRPGGIPLRQGRREAVRRRGRRLISALSVI